MPYTASLVRDGAGRTRHGEWQNRRKNGEICWERARISPIRAGAGDITSFVAVKEDLTEVMRQEHALQGMNRL